MGYLTRLKKQRPIFLDYTVKSLPKWEKLQHNNRPNFRKHNRSRLPDIVKKPILQKKEKVKFTEAYDLRKKNYIDSD